MSPFSDFSSTCRTAGLVRLNRGLLIAAMLCGLAACGGKKGDEGKPPGGAMPAMPVSVIEIQPRQVPIRFEAVGQTQGSKEVEVRARVSGILLKQHYNEGQVVKAGATLFKIDPAQYEIAVMQARAELAQAQANLDKAQRDAARLKPLIESRAISTKDYDDATAALNAAQANRQAAQANLKQAQLNLSYTTVTAPITGVTGRAQRSEGSLVTAADASGLLTTMAVTHPIWVRFSLAEAESAQVRAALAKGGNDKTSLKLLLPDGTTYPAPGTLNFTASTVDQQTGAVQLRAQFPNERMRLLPGQFVRVEVTSGEQTAFLVPQSASFQSDQGRLVWLVGPDNKAQPRPIKTRGWLGADWIVAEGLKAGDKVIVDNLLKLRPGAPVAPKAAPPSGPAAGSQQPVAAQN